MVFRKKMEEKNDRKLMPSPILTGGNGRKKEQFRTLLMFFAFLISLSVLITGCTSQNHNGTNTPAVSGNTGGAGVSGASGGSSSVGIVGDKNTETQKTQNNIARAIADGTYNDQVTYYTHVGLETFEMKVVTKDNIVTDASITPVSADMMSQRYMGAVNAALPDIVIGKNINDVVIPHTVSGSSLTSAAFRQHLDELIAQNPA